LGGGGGGALSAAAAGMAAMAMAPPAERQLPEGLSEILSNLTTVVDFFATRVANAGAGQGPGGGGGGGGGAEGVLPSTVGEAAAQAPAHHFARTAHEAMAALESAVPEWDAALLRPMAELRFTYEQEPDAEEFFTPYLWALVSEAMSLVDASKDDQVHDHDASSGHGTVTAGASAHGRSYGGGASGSAGGGGMQPVREIQVQMPSGVEV
jgi:hypothetical protein